jgi:hypothetical protein
VSGGDWNTTRERKQLALDARELEREQLRLEKRQLRDLRWAVERSSLAASDWADLLALQAAHGKEGPLQLWRELVPYWRACQRCNGGADIPPGLFPQATGILSRTDQPAKAPANRTRSSKGAARKVRSDAGISKPRKVRAPQG